MTYNVFGGTLNPTQLNYPLQAPAEGSGAARLPDAFWCIFSLCGRILASIFEQLVFSKIMQCLPPSPNFFHIFAVKKGEFLCILRGTF